MGRILLLPHAPTGGLAHVGACLTVGQELRRRGHEVEMAYGGTRPEVVERAGLPWHRVPEVAPEREWDANGWFASDGELHSMVAAHAELIDRVGPDVAVSSSGIAGRLACETAGIPQLHLMHYLGGSRYGRRPVVWENRLRDLRSLGRAAWVARVRAGSLRRRARRRSPTGVIAAVRSDLGLPPAGPDSPGARDSIVAITSAPFLEPARGLPEHWRYVGPLAWSPPMDRGETLPARGERTLIYVTQGSTGDPELLRSAVSELAAADLDVLVTTGGLCDPSELAELGPGVRASGLLPGAACLAVADAAVIHGGHLTVCQALVAGTPILVVPHRNDQIGRVGMVERLGVGVGIWPRRRPHGVIARRVRHLLETPRYRLRSAEIAQRLSRGWDGARNAADLAEQLCATQLATSARTISAASRAPARPSGIVTS